MQQIRKYRLFHIGKYFAFQDPTRWSILRSGYIHYTLYSISGWEQFVPYWEVFCVSGSDEVFHIEIWLYTLYIIQYLWMGTVCLYIGKYFVFQDQTRCSILRSGYIHYTLYSISGWEQFVYILGSILCFRIRRGVPY